MKSGIQAEILLDNNVQYYPHSTSTATQSSNHKRCNEYDHNDNQ